MKMMDKSYISKITNDNHQFAYARKDGTIVVPFGAYEWGDESFVFGFARVIKNSKWGIINTLGQLVIPIKYDKIWVLDEKYIKSVRCELGNQVTTINLKKIASLCILDGLDYIKSLSIEEFKKYVGVSRIDVKSIPATETLYFQAGIIEGKVATNGLPKNPIISLVKNSNNAIFWLLHESEDLGQEHLKEGVFNNKPQSQTSTYHRAKQSYEEDDIDYMEQTLDAFEGDESNYWNIE